MRVLGDIDGDNDITIMDYLILKEYVNGNVELIADQLQTADVNQDGVVDMEDVYALREHLELTRMITEVIE